MLRRALSILIPMCLCGPLSCDFPAGPGSTGTWTVTQIPGTSTFHAIHSTDALNGWIVGDRGTILHSTDGGLSWTPRQDVIPRLLYCITFVDPQNGWIGGDSATVLHTSDGGVSWVRQYPGTDSVRMIMAMSFCSPTIGCVVTNSGQISRTTDGGSTWVLQASGTNWALTAVHLASPGQGWAIATNRLALRTTDGGEHWETHPLGLSGPAMLTDIFFIDERTGWITSDLAASSAMVDGTPLLVTTDAGTTWSTVSTVPMLSVRAIWFTERATGWLIGGGQVLASQDGGRSWGPSYSSDSDFFVDMFFSDPHRGWVLGYYGTLLRYQSPGGL
jgi:photosystem II stability/assembly factor-like uncharacterized protein